MSSAGWVPERPTDAGRAAALVAGAFPSLAGAEITGLAEGWDNTVFRVGSRWAFRFPRRAIALPGVRRELAVLPVLAPLLPAAVPVPLLVGQDDDPADPWPFAGALMIEGAELADSALPDGARVPLARATGAFLRVLHAPDTAAAVTAALRQDRAGAGPQDLPVDPMHRAWPRARRSDTRARLALLAGAGTWPQDPAVEALLERAAALGEPAGPPVLVHGDLHARHLLVDAAGALAGVIDWGDVCWADASVDLSVAYAAFAGPAREELFAAYGRVEAATQLRARALAVRLCAFLAEYAAADDRPLLLAEALAGLHRAVR